MDVILQQILYFLGHGFCHQYAERSLEAGGLYFCVCARCTGIYLGFIVTLLVVAILVAITARKSEASDSAPTGMPPTWVVVICVLLIVPMAIDGVGSYARLFETTNLARYITGYLCGTSLAIIASGGVTSLWLQPSESQSTVNTPARLVALLLVSATAGALFYKGYPFMGILAPIISLASLWLAVTVVILLIVSTTRLWQPNSSAAYRTATIALCLLAALMVLAAISLVVSLFGALIPWYVHP